MTRDFATIAIAGFACALLATPASALDLNSFRAQAQTNCWCQGCGCKGGPGWRGPNRQCVSHRELSKCPSENILNPLSRL